MEFEKLTKAKMIVEYKKLLAEKEKAVKDSEKFCKELKGDKVFVSDLTKKLEVTEKSASKFANELNASIDEIGTLKSKIAEMEKAAEETVVEAELEEDTFEDTPEPKKRHKKLKTQKPSGFDGMTEFEIVQELSGRKLG